MSTESKSIIAATIIAIGGIVAALINAQKIFFTEPAPEPEPKSEIALEPKSAPEPEPKPKPELAPQPSLSNLSGNWLGNLYQNENFTSYLYELNLFQEGNSVKGNATLKAPNGYIATWRIRGTFDGNVLEYDDVQILQSNASPHNWRWCHKSITLDYNNSTLQGEWWENGCGSGQISLTKNM